MEQAIVVIVTVSIIVFFFFISRSKRPLALPIVGHLYLLGKLPHKSLEELAKKYGDVLLLKFGPTNTLVVSSEDSAREVLKTQDHVFASRPFISPAKYFAYNASDLAWAPYGDRWRSLRRFCTLELLTARRVNMFQHVRRSELSVLLRELAIKKTPVNLSEKIRDVTFYGVVKMVLNKSLSSADNNEKMWAKEFKAAIAETVILANCTLITDLIPWLEWLDPSLPKFKSVCDKLDKIVQREVDEHRLKFSPGHDKDFMDVMISADANDTTIKALTLDMIGAGTDTSGVVVEWALSELMNNRELLRTVQEELDTVVGKECILREGDLPKLKYLEAVVKETLRLHAPVPLLVPHESTEECRVGGITVPAKTRLIVNAYAIQRNEMYWKEPLKFDPQRFLGDNNVVDVRGQQFCMLPFGSGRRMCPGLLLGLTTSQFILGSLLHCFNWEMADGVTKLDMEEAFGVTLGRASPLELTPSPRLSREVFALL